MCLFLLGILRSCSSLGKCLSSKVRSGKYDWSLSRSQRHESHFFFFQIRESKEKERLEKRLLEELFKMFMDSDSFYYSLSYDLTNSVQRQSSCEKTNLPLWRKVSALCLFLPPGMSCPVMVMVQTWLICKTETFTAAGHLAL